jgi:hypothetical protein
MAEDCKPCFAASMCLLQQLVQQTSTRKHALQHTWCMVAAQVAYTTAMAHVHDSTVLVQEE